MKSLDLLRPWRSRFGPGAAETTLRLSATIMGVTAAVTLLFMILRRRW